MLTAAIVGQKCQRLENPLMWHYRTTYVYTLTLHNISFFPGIYINTYNIGHIISHRLARAHAMYELLSYDYQNRAFEGNTRFHQPPPPDVLQRSILQVYVVGFLLAVQHILRLSVPLPSLRLCVVCPHRDASLVRAVLHIVCMVVWLYGCFCGICCASIIILYVCVRGIHSQTLQLKYCMYVLCMYSNCMYCFHTTSIALKRYIGLILTNPL